MQNIAVKMARWDGKRHAGMRRAVLLCILCLLAVKHINKRKGVLLMERSLRIVKESASGRGKESLRRKFVNFRHLPFQGRHECGMFQYVLNGDMRAARVVMRAEWRENTSVHQLIRCAWSTAAASWPPCKGGWHTHTLCMRCD